MTDYMELHIGLRTRFTSFIFPGEEEKKLKGKKAKEIRKKEKDSKLASREQRRKDQRERFTNREPTKIGDSQVSHQLIDEHNFLT